MNLEKLHQCLIQVARANPPGDQVPYAFEKRIMARLKAPLADIWSLWGGWLWRAVTPCVATMLVVSLWAAANPRAADSEHLALALEDTVMFGDSHSAE